MGPQKLPVWNPFQASPIHTYLKVPTYIPNTMDNLFETGLITKVANVWLSIPRLELCSTVAFPGSGIWVDSLVSGLRLHYSESELNSQIFGFRMADMLPVFERPMVEADQDIHTVPSPGRS